MSTFKDKPAASDILANSQGDIQGNFEFLQSVLNKDHKLVFNDTNATTAEGRHRSVGFIDGGAQAFPTDGLTAFMYATGGQIYFINATAGPFLVTGNASSATNGYVWLPGGILMQWGTVTPLVGGVTTPTAYNIPFPTQSFNVSLTLIAPGATGHPDTVGVRKGTVGNSALQKAQFSYDYTGSSAFDGFYWTAIGN